MKPKDRLHLRSMPLREGDRDVADGVLTAGVPLAKLIKRTLSAGPEIVMLTQPRSLAAEAIRRLKTSLVHRSEKDRSQVIVVTSPTPGDGKSMLSLNLALAFAAPGTEPTLLVDADLRRPTVGARLQPQPKVGLGEILAGRTTAPHALIELQNTPLHVLPAGEPTRDPLDAFVSDTFRDLITNLRESYTRIVIDTPPIVPFSDADAIGASSDGILMIARTGTTPRSAYVQAVGSVTTTNILGTVLNDVQGGLSNWAKHRNAYHYYYQYGEDRDK